MEVTCIALKPHHPPHGPGPKRRPGGAPPGSAWQRTPSRTRCRRVFSGSRTKCRGSAWREAPQTHQPLGGCHPSGRTAWRARPQDLVPCRSPAHSGCASPESGPGSELRRQPRWHWRGALPPPPPRAAQSTSVFIPASSLSATGVMETARSTGGVPSGLTAHTRRSKAGGWG